MIRTTSQNSDFIALVRLLDADLALRDGDEHDFYAQFNSIDMLNNVVVFYNEERAVGCGAFKSLDENTVEIKRMFTLPDQRGKGIASQILNELESWAAELKVSSCILETGVRQPEAIALYEKNGYARIPNYGQYSGIENSLCFEKKLN